MRICYFGNYDSAYSRTAILRKGLTSAGAEIIDCHSKKKGISFYIDLYNKQKKLQDNFDVVFIGNSGPSYFLPLFAKLVTQKKVVWEPLFSIYDNYIFDRKLAPRLSLKALYYYSMDWVGAHVSDAIVLDTETHCEYFEQTFKIKKKKCVVAFIGADTNIFKNRASVKEEGAFEVEYHGKYIPVQGTEVIVKAAKLLEDDKDIKFTMIGGGQMYTETVQLASELKLKNIKFLPFMPLLEIVDYIARADVCCGLLGDVPRVHRAIPNKLYEAAAMGRVAINADTKALREVFTPGEDVVVIPPGDHKAFAEAVRNLKQTREFISMGKKALSAFQCKVSTHEIGKRLYEDLQKVVDA